MGQCIFGLAKNIAEAVEFIHIGDFTKKFKDWEMNQGILVDSYETSMLLNPNLPVEKARSVVFSWVSRVDWNLEHDTYRAAMGWGIVILSPKVDTQSPWIHTLKVDN